MNWQPIDGIAEVVNDLNSTLTNFWVVLRDYREELQRLLESTPFSEIEWNKAKRRLASCTDVTMDGGPEDLTRMAADFFTVFRQSRLGIGKDYATPTSRLRRGMNEQVSAWLSAIDALQEVSNRLQRVEIVNMDFIKFMQKYDHKNALHYIDPPYATKVRTTSGQYGEFEMTRKDHKRLRRTLPELSGKFMLSGYHDHNYDSWAEDNGFHAVERTTVAHSSNKKVKPKRTEVLWINYKPRQVA